MKCNIYVLPLHPETKLIVKSNLLKTSIMSIFRKQLEKQFRLYQSVLSDRMKEQGRKNIDLESITNDYCCIDGDARITIKRVPLSGDSVYYTVKVAEDSNETTDIEVEFDEISERHFEYAVDVMRKAMIVEELRNTFVR